MAGPEFSPHITVLLDPDVIVQATLVAWLVGKGANPQRFSSPRLSEIINGFQRVMPEVTKPSATTWMHLNTSLLKGAVLFGGVNGTTNKSWPTASP